MKVLVTYFSQTGNTEKLAKAIFEAIESSEKEILPIQEVTAVEGYDIIFIGFPVQSHSMPGKVEVFAKRLPDGQKVAYFATHGSMRGGQLAVTAFYDALSISKNAMVLGTFGCQGKIKQKILDDLMEKPEHQAWAREALSAISHPDVSDLEDGCEWVKKIVSKAHAL
jgi:flavodoxin